MATQDVVSRPSVAPSSTPDLATVKAQQNDRNDLQRQIAEARQTPTGPAMAGDPTKDIEVDGRSIYSDRNLALVKKLQAQPAAPGVDAVFVPQYPDESLDVSVLRTPGIGEVRIHTPIKSFDAAEKSLHSSLSLLEVVEKTVGAGGATSLKLAQLPADKFAVDLRLTNGAAVTKLLTMSKGEFSKEELDKITAEIKQAVGIKASAPTTSATTAASTPVSPTQATSTTPVTPTGATPRGGATTQQSTSQQSLPTPSTTPPSPPAPKKADQQAEPKKDGTPQQEPKPEQERKELSGLDKLSPYDADLAKALQKKGIISDASIQVLVDKLGSRSIGQGLFQDSIAGALALEGKEAAAKFEKVLAQGGAHGLEKAKLTAAWDYRPLK